MPQTVTASQTATSSWVTVSGSTVDTSTNGETRLLYYLTATTNDVEFQIQGSVNNTNWVALNTRDLTATDLQDETITVSSGDSAVAVISPEDREGINSGWKYYRTQIRGDATYGTGTLTVFAK